MRILKLVLVVVLSAGWVLPLFLAVHLLAQWNELVAQAGSVPAALAANSFPFSAGARNAAAVASLWALAAIAAWIAWFAWFAVARRPNGGRATVS